MSVDAAVGVDGKETIQVIAVHADGMGFQAFDIVTKFSKTVALLIVQPDRAATALPLAQNGFTGAAAGIKAGSVSAAMQTLRGSSAIALDPGPLISGDCPLRFFSWTLNLGGFKLS